MGWLRHLYARFRDAARSNALPDFDAFWAKGWLEVPPRSEEFVLFETFRADPVAHPLGTPSGKIELYSARIEGFGHNDCPPHPSWIEPREWLGGAAKTYPLHLVSSQPRYRLHSQMDVGPVSARGKVAGHEAIAINPADAAARVIKDGDIVRVFNARGACLAGAVLSEAMLPGVVRLSCGAWYDPADAATDALCRHGNPNVLTADRGTSQLSQGPSPATTMVEIARLEGAAPAVRAFQPPPFAEAQGLQSAAESAP
jgi:biotin/methionine sulfoxide reductase